MIAHGKEIKVFCGNANRKFAEGVCAELGINLGDSEVKSFSDGEISVSVNETVRGCDVFVVQSTCTPVNDNLMELLIMIDAFRRASAGRIPAVTTIPLELNTYLFPRDLPSVANIPEDGNEIFSAKEVGEPPLVLANSVFFAIKAAIRASRLERGLDGLFRFDAPATVQEVRRACEVSNADFR